MAECYDTTIIIGGRIKRADLDKLWDAIEEEGLFDLCGSFSETADRDNYEITPGETIALSDPERPWGRFEHLESVLVKLGLPFERYSDDGDRRIYMGAGEPEDTPASTEGSAIIDSEQAKALGSYEAILAYFERADFSPPPLVIVEDDEEELAAAGLPQDAQPIDLSGVPVKITADEIISCLAGALQACETQMEQMAGLFPDEDGTIKAALEAGEHAWAALDAYRKGEPMPDPGSDDEEDDTDE